MAISRLTVARFDLGLLNLDGPAALARLRAAAHSTQAVLIEKNDRDENKITIGVRPVEVLRVIKGQVICQPRSGRSKILPGNPFRVLAARVAAFKAIGAAEPFSTGAIGWMSYEMARHLERVPLNGDGEEAVLMFFDELIICDRRAGKTEFVAVVPAGHSIARKDAARRARAAKKLLKGLTPRPVVRVARASIPWAPAVPARPLTVFQKGVRALKEHIRAGDIFQAVLSESFSAKVAADPLDVYRAFQAVTPTPYMFVIQDGARYLLGASPERLIRVLNGIAQNCPIAGTRGRGRSAVQDRALARALAHSPKERAEHLMLVDLARNDLGRVCAPGSVRVNELLGMRRFPTVMHLVSEVEGRLERGRTAWDALTASFPAGTVSGAPKVRAIELIGGLEKNARGFYGGVVLQSDFSGNLDTILCIRTLELKHGRVRLQAGAGIVADSSPVRETQEILHKLDGLRRALAVAERR